MSNQPGYREYLCNHDEDGKLFEIVTPHGHFFMLLNPDNSFVGTFETYYDARNTMLGIGPQDCPQDCPEDMLKSS